MSTFALGLLCGFGFWLQLSLGCIAILLIHDLTGGRWGVLISPILKWSLSTLYSLAVVFVLLAAVSPWIYPPYSSFSIEACGGFFARGLIDFLIWITIVNGYRSRQRQNRETRVWSAVSLMVLLFTVSFSAMDWFMRIDENWSSTGFGLIFIAGCLVAGFGFATAVAALRFERLATNDPEHALILDLGNLLMMAVLFWAYVDFMQYLIIWSAQIPREIHWYDLRSRQNWWMALILLIACGLILPFFTLLFRSLKRRPKIMALVALSALFSRFLETLIWISPPLQRDFPAGLLVGLVGIAAVGWPWRTIYRHAEKREPLSALRTLAQEVTS